MGWCGGSVRLGQLQYDASGLIVNAKVTDDAFAQTETAPNLWRGDSLQFAVSNGLPGENPTSTEIGAALLPTGPAVYTFGTSDGSPTGTTPGAAATITRADGVTSYQVKVPWTALGFQAAPTGPIAISLALNENDGAGRAGAMQWASGIVTGKTPPCTSRGHSRARSKNESAEHTTQDRDGRRTGDQHLPSGHRLLIGFRAGGGRRRRHGDVTVGQKPTPDQAAALKTWTDRVAEVEKANPKIKIEGSEYGYDVQTFQADLAAGTLPTVVAIPYTDVQGLIERKQLADITDVVKASPVASKINPEVLKTVQDSSGKIFGLPVQAYTMSLNYNRALFEQAGLTGQAADHLGRVRADAKAIADKTGKAGYAMMTTATPAAGCSRQ